MKIVKGNFTTGNVEKKDKIAKHFTPDYSLIFREIIKPYLRKDLFGEDIDAILRLAMLAWNMANLEAMKVPGHKQLFAATMKDMEIRKKELATVKAMILEIKKKFSQHSFFIRDYKLDILANEEPRISLLINSFADFMQEEDDEEDFFSDIDEDDDEDDENVEFEPAYVERSAFILKAKPPFVKWREAHDLDFLNSENELEDTIYLIKDIDTIKDANSWLKINFERILANEFIAHGVAPEKWPEKRTFKLFNEYFEVQFRNWVMDLESEPVRKW